MYCFQTICFKGGKSSVILYKNIETFTKVPIAIFNADTITTQFIIITWIPLRHYVVKKGKEALH